MEQRLEALLRMGVDFAVTEETLCDMSPDAEALIRHVINTHKITNASLWLPEEVIDSVYARADHGDQAARTGAIRIREMYDEGVLKTVLTGQNTPASFDAIVGALHELRTIPGTLHGVITTSDYEMLRLQGIAENTPAVSGSRIICYRGEELQAVPAAKRPAEPAVFPADALNGSIYATDQELVRQTLQQSLRREGIPYAVRGDCLAFCCPINGRFHSLSGTMTFGPQDAAVRVFYPLRLDYAEQVLLDELYSPEPEKPCWQVDVFGQLHAASSLQLDRQGDEAYAETVLPYGCADVVNIRHIAESAAARFALLLPRRTFMKGV